MNIYAEVTERILSELRAGVVPWRKTWANGLPKSLATGKEYRGHNVFLLATNAYQSRYWVTFNQAKRLGGHVREGEKATPIYYWHWRTEEETSRLAAKLGKTSLAPCTAFASFVFNLEQVEGIERPTDDFGDSNNQNTLEAAEKLIASMPDRPIIEFNQNVGPQYSQLTDKISMPHFFQFENEHAYYSVLFHELVHSTGAEKRLKRFSPIGKETIETYSREELVAEFGAAFLRAFSSIRDPEMEKLSASYIDGWSTAIQKDPKMIASAAAAAQKATDYIRGTALAQKTRLAV